MSTFKLKDGLNVCSNSEYHGDKEYVSSSGLKVAYKDIAKFKHEILDGNREPMANSAALEDGSLTHSIILEPSTYKNDYAFFDGLRKAGADFEAFKAGLSPEAQNKTIISKPQLIRVQSFVEAFKKRIEAVELISGGEAEQTICATLYGVKVKVRFDYINVEKGYIADVKTTGKPADINTFKETLTGLSYELSAALYCAVAELFYGKKFDFYFIVISKQNPQECHVYKTSEATMARGLEMVRVACEKIKLAKQTGIWKETLTNSTQDDTLEVSGYQIQEV